MDDDIPLPRKHIDAVTVGASAGGIDALLKIFGGLPPDFQLPIMVVLHLRDDRDSRLAEVFQQHVRIPVRQARDKEPIDDGVLYFAGPGCHLSVEEDHRFSLSGEDAVHYSRPAIDLLMTSAADVYGERLAGILLTGANEDGAEGMASIKQAGGLTIVQDPAEAQVAVMPQSAIRRCAPDHILRLKQIRQWLIELGQS
ncbi:chemotaxis protein CheB [Oxalicibacterium flavum]|uniref:protein-glutamate methylesterase n=1 Tax=Oxalicibacterium flavum TaxID=179467 RepID=A0A8J2XX65_9BURK|nr:chemotaxis protein CheB [Oxalicibacterium flavum]GGB97610.1 chemotaxis protein CheB [Oxalicibacterium flavum]